MRQTEKKQIGSRGFIYHVTQLGARQGGRVLVRLLKMIGGAAGGAITDDTLDEFNMQALGKLITNLAENVSEMDYDFLCDTFMAGTEVSGGKYQERQISLNQSGVFDLHFAGAYAELGEWLLFALEVNYADFLGENGLLRRPVQGLPDLAKKVNKSVSKSRNTLIGQFGE